MHMHSILRIPIIILRYDFGSESSFSGVFGILLFAVIGELGSGVARFSWFSWGMLFRFPLAILLSVFICGLVSDWFSSLLCTWPVSLNLCCYCWKIA